MGHYNTTAETGQALATYQQAALKQEEAVLALFRSRRLPMSPSQVHRHLGPGMTPLTSIRRAMSNLTRDGLLEKMEVKVEGIYSHAEHLWRLGDGQ